MKSIFYPTLIFLSLLLAVLLSFVSKNKEVDFNAEIKPVLNKKCLACHGGVKQQSGLSFLFPEEAVLPAESGKRAIVPGDPKASELISRIHHNDPDERMPPEGEPLSKAEKKLLEKWILQGAKWETHWAYIDPSENIKVPAFTDNWCKNEIDQFILKKLKTKKLKPSPNAEKTSLIRRLSLDLIGLPPDRKLIDSYLNNNSSDAYEKLVDELLASPHFGERWASVWLDLARYADSQGYQKDLIRKEIWRYRDWVIHAFNQDMPFDQFTIEQLAGDLLNEPSDNQLLATAFHRNTMTNDEGGTDDEEFRVAAVVDRLNTTFEIWQGTTIGCVQCHHHPYDPIRQKEFYQLYAFFNNTADSDKSNDMPVAKLYSPAQKNDKIEIEVWINDQKENGDTLTEDFKNKIADYLKIKKGNVPVMQELIDEEKRKTYVFERGNWLVHGVEVNPGVPLFLPQLPDDYSRDRLGLAKWLVDGNNPLTARVIVNRFWEQLFGKGLVATLEDFGSQGQAATHPELLDWLAIEFVEQHQWSIKSLLKQIVLSATYRQSSIITEEHLTIDPENEYYARGPRYRLSAEQIRDQALFISGLLNPEIYGKSVMPYQPDGVWNVIRHAAKWEKDTTGNQYRRGLYTFWRRVSPYPSLVSFDAPSREVCLSRRIRTNTPLQALIILNDPVYVEAASALAEKMWQEGGEKISDKISYGFELALIRKPDEKRLNTLLKFYNNAFNNYQKDSSALNNLLENKKEKNPELAALINVASVILNLDELIMKG